MQEGLVEDTRTRKLEKKIDLILKANKSEVNYKRKIEELLKEKIKNKQTQD